MKWYEQLFLLACSDDHMVMEVGQRTSWYMYACIWSCSGVTLHFDIGSRLTVQTLDYYSVQEERPFWSFWTEWWVGSTSINLMIVHLPTPLQPSCQQNLSEWRCWHCQLLSRKALFVAQQFTGFVCHFLFFKGKEVDIIYVFIKPSYYVSYYVTYQ